MEFYISLLESAVIIMLLFAMFFATKGIKEKEDKQRRRDHYVKAAVFFVLYLGCHALRLYLQSGL